MPLILRVPWAVQPQSATRPATSAQNASLWSLALAPVRGAVVGPPAATTGAVPSIGVPHGLAWNFSGTAQYVSLGAPPDGPLSFVAIVNQGSSTSQFPISSRTDSSSNGIDLVVGLGGAGTARARVQVAGTAVQTADASGLNDGRYHVHAVTYDGATLSYYVDGALIGTASRSGTLTHTQTLRLASRGLTYFAGGLSDAAVFAASLSAFDVAQMATPAKFYGRIYSPRRMLIPVSAGAAPTFNPAWASSANSVIHGAMQ